MKDTTPEIEARYRSMLLARSGIERLRMGSDMLSAAIRIVDASLGPMSETDRRVARLRRLYASDFSSEQLRAIEERIRQHARTSYR